MDPPGLRYIVKATIVRYLACSSDISRDHLVMLEYFRGWGQGVFGEEILSQIIEDFPSQLTDELLITLAPPHLRHLKLTSCSGLSCSGLNKAIAKCQQLQALDFSECVHLLHPTVFCCIREKAANLVSLSLENSEVVSDDIVQVALMCCPSLKHLNLSSCNNITDAAFALSNFKKSASNKGSDNYTSQPGHSLTSIDISGCQSLSTVAVKYLVGLCGANLTSVNLAWTGMNCTALLYLAGLDMEKLARMMHLTDPVSADVVLSLKETKQWHDAKQDFSSQGFLGPGTMGEFSIMSEENTYVCIDSELNEMEVLTLKDVLPVTREASLLQSERMLQLQELNESPDVECHEELTFDTNFIPTCSLLPEKAQCSTASGQENSHDEQLETEDEEAYTHSCGGTVKKDGQSQRTLCWNVSTEDEHFKDSRTKDDSFNTVLLPSVEEENITSGLESVSIKKEDNIGRNPLTLTTDKKPNGELGVEEIHEDGFDTESHPVTKVDDLFVSSCSLGMNSMKNECDNLSMPCTRVNGNGPDYPIMPYEKVEIEESEYNHHSVPFAVAKCAASDNAIMTAPGVKCERSVCSIIPSVELHAMDEEVEFEEPIHCKADEGEKPCVKETDHDCFSTMACIMPESIESSACFIIPCNIEKEKEIDHSVTTCWEDKNVSSECKEKDSHLSHLATCSNVEAPIDRNLLDCTSLHGEVIQVADLLEAQTFQPQITSLDISNMWYHSKPLGQACLKVFSQANKCLKNFAVSWSGLDDRMLTYILKNEPELQCLSLVDCEKLSNLSLSSIPVHCPKLNSFDLKGMCYVTDHGLMPLARSNHLQSLSLAEAPITDCTLESIAKGCGAKLKVLDISWCEDVTDRGMSITANACRSLQHLGLRQCAASKCTISTLSDSCHLLSSLNIAGIDNFTDTALSSLAEGMPLLAEIDASWNSSLSDKGISALLRCCHRLKKVVLCGLKVITSQPFLGIIGDLRRWHLMEELWRYNRRFQTGKVALRSCDFETAKSLGGEIPSRSMAYAPSLRHLVLEYSDKVNDDHLAAIVAVCRGTLFVKDYYGQPVEPKWIFR